MPKYNMRVEVQADYIFDLVYKVPTTEYDQRERDSYTTWKEHSKTFVDLADMKKFMRDNPTYMALEVYKIQNLGLIALQ